MTVGLLVLGGPRPVMAGGGVTPASEAKRLAEALYAAAAAARGGAGGGASASASEAAVREVEAIIREIMEALQVPTLGPNFGLDSAGGAASPGFGEVQVDEGAAAIGLFEVEIPIIAKAFVEGKYTALEDLVQAWKAGAIGFEAIGGAEFTSAGVEAVLRQVRQEAEASPDDWGGFVIRLVDELGDREQYAFSLLGEERGGEKPKEAAGGSVQAVGATMARDAAQAMISGFANDAASEMGWDSQAMQAQLSSPQNMQQMMQGMLDQNMWSIAAPFLQAAQAQNPGLPSVQEIQNMMAQAAGMMSQAAAGQIPGGGGAGAAGGQQLTPEMRQYMQAAVAQTEVAMSGDISGASAASDEMTRANMKMRVAQLQQAAVGEREDVADEYGDEPDALRFVDLGARVAGVDAIRNTAEDDLESFEELLENREEERAADDEREQQTASKMVIQLEDEDTSKLMLDPVQIWLISMDLIDAARPGMGVSGGVRP